MDKKNFRNRGPFTQIPNIFFDANDLSETAQVLYLQLYRHVGYKDGKYTGSVRKIANTVRMSKSTVDRALKELEQDGFVSVTSGTGKESEQKVTVIDLKVEELWSRNATVSEQTESSDTGKSAIRQRISKSIELQTMPYSEYLQSPEWQEKRAQALRLAEYRCQVCNVPGQLQVHHRDYERRGREAMSDLVVLCQGCHDIFHSNGKLHQ